jgi:hypothetical protein
MMNVRALVQKVRMGDTSLPTFKLLTQNNYHPGFAPEPPRSPGRRAGTIARVRYRIERWRWRNHYLKQGPFWRWYNIYLACRYWLEMVRPRVLARDGFQCTYRSHGKRCQERGTDPENPLQIHHTKYRIGGQWLVGRELEYDNLRYLRTMCKDHHKMIDGEDA